MEKVAYEAYIDKVFKEENTHKRAMFAAQHVEHVQGGVADVLCGHCLHSHKACTECETRDLLDRMIVDLSVVVKQEEE